MDVSFYRSYVFDGFTLDLTRGCLLQGGSELKLRPKSFKALVYLVENAGRLISKQELIAAIWPDVTVTDDSLVQCLIEVRKTLGVDAQRYVKTVPRRGYIFTAQVAMSSRALDEASDEPAGHADVSPKGPTVIRLREKKKAFATLTLTVILLSVVYRFAFRGPLVFSSAEFRSVAVLPFKVIGTSGDEELLAAGMADTLITKLSNVKEIIVRSTSAVRRYAKPDQDPVAVGREQGVDAVLDGSIQKSGGSIRVSVQLLRVKDAKLLWAD
jgi:DNA-binding winged helix-turn-helix (wHTH) protein